MDVFGILVALMTVLAWGSWLVPSHEVRFPSEQVKSFYVALAAAILALLVFLLRVLLGVERPDVLGRGIAWVPAGGGIVWAVSSYCAFVGCKHLGIARAFGIWAPLNIITSFFWGLLLFGQFRQSSGLIYLIALQSMVLMLIGIFLILFSGSETREGVALTKAEGIKGVLGACGAGVLWGTYYVPAAVLSARVEAAEVVSAYTAALPLSLGMLLGTSFLVLGSGKALQLRVPSDYGRALFSGLLWAVGNYGMLLTVGMIGTGPGYTVASLCVVVNALWGIFYFRQPDPRSKAARWVLLGVCLATAAGVVLGNLGIIEASYRISPIAP